MDNMLDALRIGLEMEAFWQFLSTLRCALQCVTKQIQSIWSEFNDAPIQERESITRHWLTLYENKKLREIDLFLNKNYLVNLSYQNLSVDITITAMDFIVNNNPLTCNVNLPFILSFRSFRLQQNVSCNCFKVSNI